MHEATVILYECKPLKARISKETCKAERAKRPKRKLQFNNGLDYEGLPINPEACVGCPGVTGDGEEVTITAGEPRGPRVPVPTLYGGYGYV